MPKKKNIVFSILFVVAVIIGTVCLTVTSKDLKETYALGSGISSINVNNDVVTINSYSSSGIMGFYIGTSSDMNAATYYKSNGTSTLKVSLLNGTYNIWIMDKNGTVTKYNKKFTVSNSCSSDFLNNAKGTGEIKHCYFTSDGTYLFETKSESLVRCADGYRRDESQTRVVQDNCSGLTRATINGAGLVSKVCSKTWTYACVPTSGGSGVSVVNATTTGDWTNYNKEITVTSKKGGSEIAGYYISTNSAKPNAASNWVASNSTTWKTTQGAGTYYIWVKDAAGNISNNYKSVTVSKIETTPPVVDSLIPSSSAKNLTIKASDEGGSGIGGYYISTENTAPTLSSEWINTNDANYTVGKEPGTYYVWAKDAAGNISASSKKATIAESSTTDNNNLASLTIKDVEITPAFDANVTEYTAISTYSSITVDATLQDSNASFVNKFGPRKVNLKSGVNNVLIKVKSSLGNEKTYTIKVTYNGKSSNGKVTANLKSLKLNSGNLTFDKDITEYRMYVPRSLEKLEIEAEAEDPNADIKIENPEKLEIGDNKVTITVTASNGTTKVYTLNIIKKETNSVSTNNYLRSLKITGYDIDFKRDTLEYKIKLGNKTYLNINAVAEDSNAEVTIDNTKYLTKDSIINVMVRAEDGSARIYKIYLNKSVLSVGTIILIIIGSLVVLAIIAFVVLKMLGYSIYINFGAIKDFFIKLFKRNKE